MKFLLNASMVATMAGMETIYRTYPHVCPSPMLNYPATAEFLTWQQQRPTMNSGMEPFSGVTKQPLDGRFITLDHLHQGGDRDLSSLE